MEGREPEGWRRRRIMLIGRPVTTPTSSYKCSTYYDPLTESGFAHDDPGVGIAWPEDVERVVSARDRAAPALDALGAPS